MNVPGMDRTVTAGSPLKLSAAESFDEDVRGKSNNLQYNWTCKECACVSA